MYLKTLEIIGFKSFAEKTKLSFEPGMTAIVGPNGCGKSNVADAIRWVLGEQSAKALRGSKMEDVIFNGTDTHKPLGMAEVSLTLADCEKILGVEYNEVTITRRVYRSGEGHYFINKTPCRLKDIQRLFMDTGIGTNSYSLMEQGRIDKILSSHPEDRRAVFEEASGITKYKADRREAMRKLEQTEANLLRLEDVVKEVKRQIISLQRQAGKARRYQEIYGRLRELDLYASRERINQLDGEIKTLESRIASISEQDEAIKADIAQTEQQANDVRSQLSVVEQHIQETMEAGVRARTELERVRELIRNNQDRINEMRTLSERDTRDAEGAKANKAGHEKTLEEINEQHEQASDRRDQADKELAEHVKRLNEAEQRVSEATKLLHNLRTEQIDLESRVARLQNELAALDAEERQNIIRRERLSAEHAEMQRNLELFQGRQADMVDRLKQLQEAVERSVRQLETFQGQRADKNQLIQQLRQKLGDFKSQIAAKQARIDMLKSSEAERKGFPEGARQILDPKSSLRTDRANVLGPLSELVRAEPEYHIALEAALRPWLDAVVVRDDGSAMSFLRELEALAKGAARLLTASGSATAEIKEGVRLVNHVSAKEDVQGLVERLIGNVVVVNNIEEIPSPRPAGIAYVTRTGSFVSDAGAEFWKRENEQSNPLARQQTLAMWQTELDQLTAQRDEVQSQFNLVVNEEATMGSAIDASRKELEESRRQLAQAEGENRVITREAQQARQRAETVAYELKAIEEKAAGGSGRREGILQNIDTLKNRMSEIRSTISDKTEELRDLDQIRTNCMTEVSDRRVRYAEARQQVESLVQRRQQITIRIAELQSLIEERARGVSSYQTRIAELENANKGAAERISPLEAQAAEQAKKLDEARMTRDKLNISLGAANSAIHEKREMHDEVREKRSACEVEVAQQRMRRQNLADRVTGEWKVMLDDVFTAKEPSLLEGQEKQLDREGMETEIAELRAKMEAMGPVNLVAIEEHRELEERYTFLTTQQNDLMNAKQQLMELIQQINKTTTEMFAETFNKVNENFQMMFSQLFGGGTAKLVLVEDGDILESGIEIIARPPGKKLQSVSLLSGGERTMTAVGLLFALYMVKPSAFCVLDELDAALDEANIGRFVKTVQGFMDRSQFVVITHNRMTIAAAGTLYGVTMEVRGVSKIVSVKFNEEDKRERAVVHVGKAASASEAVAPAELPPAEQPETAAPVAVEEPPVEPTEPPAPTA